MNSPVRIIVIVLLVAPLFSLVITFARGVSAEEPTLEPITVEEALEEPMDPDERSNLEADRDADDPADDGDQPPSQEDLER